MKKRSLISIMLTLLATLGILLAMGLTVHAEEYDLWIGGEQVTGENQADIKGDGVFSYNNDEKKLEISGNYFISENNDTIINHIDGLMIDVLKDSNVRSTWNMGAGLNSKGDVTIRGDGELYLESFHGYVDTDGIYMENHRLTVDHMCLQAIGSDNPSPMQPSAASPARGIRGSGENASLNIVSSYVKAGGTVTGFSGGITLDGCSIIYPQEAYIQNGAIYDSNGKLAELIVIAPDPTHIVIANALNVRKDPDTDSDRIGGLTQDKEVIVLETQGEWSKIVYGTDFGWVQSKYLKEIEKEIYTVEFNANGGSGTMPEMTVKEGEKLTLPECTFTPPEGKVFDRWIAGYPGEQVEVGGDSIIRAFWKDSPQTNPFVDIYESDDYYDAVLWAYYADPQITNGMDETHFGPDLTVTRAQAVTFLWRSQGCPEPSSTVNPFADVPTGEWYYKPVLWAVENNITKGTTDTTFSPYDTLTTAHMITFLYRTKNPGMDGWNGEAAAWAADENGRPFGVDIAVNNTTPCPRCNVVQFLYQLNK